MKVLFTKLALVGALWVSFQSGAFAKADDLVQSHQDVSTNTLDCFSSFKDQLKKLYPDKTYAGGVAVCRGATTTAGLNCYFKALKWDRHMVNLLWPAELCEGSLSSDRTMQCYMSVRRNLNITDAIKMCRAHN